MVARRCPKPLPELRAHQERAARLGVKAVAPYGQQALDGLPAPRAQQLLRQGLALDALIQRQEAALATKGARCPRLDIPTETTRWWDRVRFGGWGEVLPSTLDPLDEPQRIHEAALTIALARSRAAAQTRAAAQQEQPKEVSGGV